MARNWDERVRTCYMSRRVELPPLVAGAAYDALACESYEGGSGRLHLRGPVRRFSGTGWWPLLSQPGTLSVGRLRWPVELELLPWSRDCTELGLRPQSHLLRTFPPESVTLVGLALLEHLAERMHGWADAPLRNWASEFGSRSSTGKGCHLAVTPRDR